MAPAALHRQAERGWISTYLADYGSRQLTLAMVPLMLAISLDLGLVAFLIVTQVAAALLVGAASTVTFTTLWFGIPAHHRKMRRTRQPLT